jgi:opacity protein-like surface antigen
MRFGRLLAPALLLLAVAATPARADLTAFIGAQTSPSTRVSKGLAIGAGVLVLGFEFEYAQVNGDDTCPAARSTIECAPTVRTGMANVLVQTPRGVVPKMQLYATVGGGIFRERFEALDIQETNVGTNLGGGAKIELAGPLRLRLDYRVFKFGGSAVYDKPQRFSIGVNLAF